ncbi:MAG: hypothetical protein QOF35_2065 [Actinomycetota bacterium]|jgi:hypothetical protein|nr:hypothetical protein [Actinomycetota bacterium]
MNRRSIAGISLIWLLTVAGVSATAWFAIDRAGRDLTGADVAALDPPQVGVPAVLPAPSATPPATGPPPVGDKSVSVLGGQVTVRCKGAAILLRGAQPDSGWRVDVVSPGPSRIQLRFKLGAGDAGPGTAVSAVCMNDIPVFDVQPN